MITTEEAKFAVDVAQTIGLGIIAVMNWLYNRQRVTNATINKLEDNIDNRMDDYSTRLVRVEQDLKNAPNHNDLAELYREMRKLNDSLASVNASLSAQLSSQTATLTSLKGQVERMDSFWRSKN